MNDSYRLVVGAVLFALAGTSGLPAQDRLEPVPNSVLSLIGGVLPERSNAGAAFLSDSYTANLAVDQSCTIEITLLWEGAGYRNSLGYFTYTGDLAGNVSVTSSNLIEPNCSFPGAGSMASGDTYVLRGASGDVRVFAPGERVGFFLIADGHRRSPEVAAWVPNYPDVPSQSPAANRQIGRGLFTTLPSLNPEVELNAESRAKHLAMLAVEGVPGFLDGDDFLLCGFEDLHRSVNSDDDFNDLVFVIRSDPVTAVSTTTVFPFAPGDRDGDGVLGVNDHFPNDPSRATSIRSPSNGWDVLAFEDNYPQVGDADFNDAVFAYAFETVRNSDGDVTDVIGTFHLVARGAAYDHALGLHMPGLPGSAIGAVSIERFLGGGSQVIETPIPRSLAEVRDVDQRRIPDIFDSTTAALPPDPGQTFTNTLFLPQFANAGSSRVWIRFDEAVDESVLGTAPFDLYLDLLRFGNGPWDIHRPGFPSFADRSTHLPTESGADAFLDANGMPWVLDVPRSWRCPMERVHVESAYVRFASWRSSSGQQELDWYATPESATGLVSEELAATIPSREWTLVVPR